MSDAERLPAPENVRIVYPDGREVPCELVYAGVREGAHVWRVVNAELDLSVCKLKVDVLPARTLIELLAHGPLE